MKYVSRLKPAATGAVIEKKADALRAAFPNHSVERILLLGRDTAGREGTARHFDRVLMAVDVFL